jgi:putative chitinase
MAVNPITSDDLSIDLKSLLRLSIRDRVQAAESDPGFAQALIQSLTPIQLAKAFPDYYRRELPDISNFITTNVSQNQTARGGVSGGGGGGGGGGGWGGETATPEPKLTAGQFRAVEGTMLAGSVDVAKRVAAQSKTGKTTPKQNTQLLLDAMNKRKINDPQVRAAIAAVVQGESGFSPRSEQDYSGTSNQRIREIFSSTRNLNDEQLTALKRNPEAFFNHVYGGRADLGNASDEGYKYRGRGFLQLTGKANYKKYGDMIGVDLVKNPDLANDPKIAADLAAVYVTDRFTNAPGKSTMEKVFRAVGNPVAETEGVKVNAYNQFMTTGDYAPGREADLSGIESQLAETTTTQADALAIAQGVAGDITMGTAEMDVSGDSLVAEAQSDIAKTRKKPITPELKEVLQFAAEESGVQVEVFSGGQADIMQGGPRTGTERHDLGHAADIRLKVKNSDGSYRYLSSNNEADRKIMAKFITNSRKMGATGIGSGLGYMGESGIHIGTVVRPDIDYSNKPYGAPAGKEAVWQSDEWAQEAFAEGQRQAVEFQKTGGMPALRKAREEKIAQLKKDEEEKVAGTETISTSNVEIVERSGAELLPESHPFSMNKSKKDRIIAAQKEQVAMTEPTTPVPTFRTGGNPYTQDDEDFTAVGLDGKPRFKFNSGEGLYVKPEANQYADNKIDELSGRVDEMSKKFDDRDQEQSKMADRNLPDKLKTSSDTQWSKNVTNAVRPAGTQQRAFNRAQFRSEGRHIGDRGSPNIA